MSHALSYVGRAAGPALALGAAGVLMAATGCGVAPAPENSAGPAQTRVVSGTGSGTGLQTFTVRRHGRLIRADFLNTGGGAWRIVTTARSGRGLDRADARAAYDAAFEAAQNVNCGGRSLTVVADSATYIEDDRRSALTQGAPGWMFAGRCG